MEGGEIITEGTEKAEILNKSFSNAVKNLEIPRFCNTDPLVDHISYPTFRAILKFQTHLSVPPSRNSVIGKIFSFSRVSVAEIVKEIKILGTRKALKSTDIPIKIVKENADIFGDYI